MKPYVSCLCLTRNRRFFLRRAVEFYLSQQAHFADGIELVIIDGSDERNREFGGQSEEAQQVMSELGIRYHHLPAEKKQPGHWRNVGVSACQGEIIIHWDDDDWQAPNRVQRQVDHLRAAGQGTITGTNDFYWYSLVHRQAARSQSWGSQKLSSSGASLAYWRSAWERLPFRAECPGAEDTWFLIDHCKAGTHMYNSRDPDYHVYIRHNTNGSVFTTHDFQAETTERVRVLMGPNVEFYDEISEILPLAAHNDLSRRTAPGGVTSTPLEALRMRHYRR